ncbi:unnamed protein product [Moritella viscosa]|uniref:Uncharacterized protein n=1 Tax=Moritella viscosa TaxID=80854 RepID=A0ABY1HCT9_9GAMM|nr:unnamed protein product [Moritella viscosa]SGZ01833.1 unnamed protein product [Moritella viscosa]SHO21988.1 unnamed protein product [Moritella viscosa]SHO26312.1 unnamed protein product [Moritella viscosa]
MEQSSPAEQGLLFLGKDEDEDEDEDPSIIPYKTEIDRNNRIVTKIIDLFILSILITLP